MTTQFLDRRAAPAAPSDMPHSGESPRDVAVVLPYAVGIRDFVHSGVLARLLAMPDIRLTIYTINADLPELAEAREAGVEVRSFEGYRDNRLEGALKRLYLYFFADRFVYIEQMLAGKPLHRLLANVLCLTRRVVGTGRFLRLCETIMLSLYRRRNIPWRFAGTPDLVIATRSLMNSLDYGLIAEARERGIPVLTIANSWDNFTTKGFFPFKAERIVVWNEKMKSELEDIYEVSPREIAIVGYPRRQTLVDLSQGSDPAAYLASLGYGQYRRFILYSASYSELTRIPGEAQPLEYQVMAQVAARLEAMLPDDVCILLRMHPFSEAGDESFSGLTRSFIFVPGRKDSYVERVMGREDEVHLARQIALSECVLSMASTMTIDALSLDRPVLNTRFDPRAGIPFIWSNARFYAFNHFRDLADLVKLPMAASVDEVVAFVEAILAGDHPAGGDMEAFRAYYVPDASRHYALAVSNVVRQTLHLSALAPESDRQIPANIESER